jgi:hypothetical protein
MFLKFKLNFSLVFKERKEIVSKAHDYRGNHSEAGIQRRKTHEKKPERIVAKKDYKKSTQWKDYSKVYLKKWIQTPKGRKLRQLSDAKRFAKHPWKIEALKSVWKQLSKTGHRISKPTRLNRKFMAEVEKQAKSVPKF